MNTAIQENGLVIYKTTLYTCPMEHGQNLFTVIVGDLIGSSEINDRPVVSNQIAEAIEGIGTNFRDDFHGRLTITRGMDEISGVLKRPALAYKICRELNYIIFPHCFRFAVVQNILDVNVETKEARRMDGPAFHRAADIMEQLKKDNLFYSFEVSLNVSDFNMSITALANLVSIILQRRTERQDLILREYMKSGRQQNVADKFAITQQAVSDSLKSLHWQYIKRVENLIDNMLNESV
ncbi:MAG: SatD family protein [candidate division Zixibacteria bacterium]|nr:SatD family protein [candidate division Zixibacteria bacterium]